MKISGGVIHMKMFSAGGGYLQQCPLIEADNNR